MSLADCRDHACPVDRVRECPPDADVGQQRSAKVEPDIRPRGRRRVIPDRADTRCARGFVPIGCLQDGVIDLPGPQECERGVGIACQAEHKAVRWRATEVEPAVGNEDGLLVARPRRQDPCSGADGRFRARWMCVEGSIAKHMLRDRIQDGVVECGTKRFAKGQFEGVVIRSGHRFKGPEQVAIRVSGTGIGHPRIGVSVVMDRQRFAVTPLKSWLEREAECPALVANHHTRCGPVCRVPVKGLRVATHQRSVVMRRDIRRGRGVAGQQRLQRLRVAADTDGYGAGDWTRRGWHTASFLRSCGRRGCCLWQRRIAGAGEQPQQTGGQAYRGPLRDRGVVHAIGHLRGVASCAQHGTCQIGVPTFAPASGVRGVGRYDWLAPNRTITFDERGTYRPSFRPGTF